MQGLEAKGLHGVNQMGRRKAQQPSRTMANAYVAARERIGMCSTSNSWRLVYAHYVETAGEVETGGRKSIIPSPMCTDLKSEVLPAPRLRLPSRPTKAWDGH
jgi:hypothetical protein